MRNRIPIIFATLALGAVLCVMPTTAAEAEKLEPDSNLQREIGLVVASIVRVSEGGDTQAVLDRIQVLETAAKGSRKTLLLQLALYLRDAKGTEQSMGAAMLLEHLAFSENEIGEAIAPYLETDDPKLRRVFDDLKAGHEDAGPIEQSRSLIEDGKLNQAEAILKRELRNPELEAEALTLLTHVANLREDYEAGLDYGKRAIAAAPESSYAHLRYAQALRTKLQKISRARAIFSVGPYKKELRKAIELDSGNLEARSEEIGYLIHAPGVAGGSIDKANERIDELEKLDRREALFMRAELYDKDENSDGMVDVYQQLVELYPEEDRSRLRLALALQAVQRYEKADAQFMVLLDSEEPGYAQLGRYQLARSRVIGNYDQEQAATYLIEYLEKLPETPSKGLPQETHAYWRLGMAYEQLQRIENARGAYQKAIELDSENKEARAALKKLPRG
jgi:hypothetical protein